MDTTQIFKNLGEKKVKACNTKSTGNNIPEWDAIMKRFLLLLPLGPLQIMEIPEDGQSS